MSVLLETSLGELVIDLEVDKCPRTCENFLKLCKVKYYALNAFFNGASRVRLRLRLSYGLAPFQLAHPPSHTRR